MDYPVNDGWLTGFGDITVGGKFNVVSQATNNGVAFAVRAAVKLPTASFDDGLGTGKPDFLVDGILSKEINNKVDVAGYGGLLFRGSPDDYEMSHGLRYGFGFGWPSRGSLKMFGEATGEFYFDNTITFSGTPNAALGGPASSWDVDQPFDVFLGVQYQAPQGFYVGTGLSWGINTIQRGSVQGYEDNGGDRLGLRFDSVTTPVWVLRTSAATSPATPTAATAVHNRAPTVKAREPARCRWARTDQTLTPTIRTLTRSPSVSAPTGTFTMRLTRRHSRARLSPVPCR
jgi:hypothetical protein